MVNYYLELACKIEKNVSSGLDYLYLIGGLRKIVDIDAIRFYPSSQQYELKLTIIVENTNSTATTGEIGIQENLSVSVLIPLLKVSLNANEVKSFNINQDVFLRILDKNNSSGYNYKFYTNFTQSVNVKGYVSLRKITQIYVPVPY